MTNTRRLVTALSFVFIAATISAQEWADRAKPIEYTALASLPGGATARYWRNSETGWFVQEFTSQMRKRPSGIVEKRDTKIAVLVDPYTGKHKELGQWDRIDEVFFPSGNGSPVIWASDWGGTMTADGKILESDLPKAEPFHYLQFGSRTYGPFIHDYEFFRLSRDGSSIAIFANMPDSSLKNHSIVRKQDVSRWVFHDDKAYGPYSRDATTQLIVSLGGKHLAYSLDRTAENGLYLDGKLVTAKLANNEFGFIPVADAPYPEPCSYREIYNVRTEIRDWGTHVSGNKYLCGEAHRQIIVGDNSGTELYYVEATPGGQTLSWPGGTIGPYKKIEATPLVRGTADPPFIVEAWTADGSGIVKIGSFESKPFPKEPYLLTARWSANPWYIVASASQGTLYQGDRKVASFPASSVGWIDILADGTPVMNVYSKKNALIHGGKTLGTYDTLSGPVLSQPRTDYVAFGYKGASGKRNTEFFRNGKKLGIYPDAAIFLNSLNYAMTPDGTETAFVTFADNGGRGYTVRRFVGDTEAPTPGTYDNILFGTLRYLEGNALSFIAINDGEKGEDRMCVVVDGKKFGPYPDFDYTDLRYRQDERKFDLITYKDKRIFVIEESY